MSVKRWGAGRGTGEKSTREERRSALEEGEENGMDAVGTGEGHERRGEEISPRRGLGEEDRMHVWGGWGAGEWGGMGEVEGMGG